MKKLIIIILFNAISFTTCFSQKFAIGVKPSFLVLSSKLSTGESNYPPIMVKQRISFGLGLTFSEEINRFRISAEPGFIVKGYNLDFGSGEIDIYRNNYLSLPVIFSYSPVHNLRLEIGPEFSYLLSSKVNYFSEDVFRENISHSLRSFELSLVPGISYTLMDRLDFGIRYGIGLTPYDEGQFEFTHRYFEIHLNTKIFVKN